MNGDLGDFLSPSQSTNLKFTFPQRSLFGGFESAATRPLNKGEARLTSRASRFSEMMHFIKKTLISLEPVLHCRPNARLQFDRVVY
jgi:hypothetical protein